MFQIGKSAEVQASEYSDSTELEYELAVTKIYIEIHKWQRSRWD